MALPSPTRTDDAVQAPYIPSTGAPAELTPGVSFMIPLRRRLIVKEHANLTPEERDGPQADSGPGVLLACLCPLLAIPVYAVARSRRSP
jgi:hypothetical protein